MKSVSRNYHSNSFFVANEKEVQNRSDDLDLVPFWNTIDHLKNNFSNGFWNNGFEQTLEDLELWEIIDQVKDNFSNGFLIGLEKTLKDVVFWIMSWNIWEVYNVRDWISHFLTLGNTVTSRNSGSLNSGITCYSGQILQTDCLF